MAAVVVPDTSALIHNPVLAEWSTPLRMLIVISDMVLNELDTHKEKGSDDTKEPSRSVLGQLARAAATGSLQDGVALSPSTWVCAAPVDRGAMPPGLDPKKIDHQIASVAWALRQQLMGLPVVLVTCDNNQAVVASGVGIPQFCHRGGFSADDWSRLHEVIVRVREEEPMYADRMRLEAHLPPKETIVSHFVGRAEELSALNAWLLSRRRKWWLVGDGGKGKSALAYEFVERVAQMYPGDDLYSVVWLSAKRRRFEAGMTIPVSSPDFATLEQAIDRLLGFFGESRTGTLDERREKVMSWLNTYPALIVVDDVDSIDPEHADVIEFFNDDVPTSPSRVLFTSRRSHFGTELRQTEVRGLEGEEAIQFVHTKIDEFGLEWPRFAASIDRLLEVTEGSPLYIEDLIRLCKSRSVGDAIHQWEQRRGEAARRYALEVEVAKLQADHRLGRRMLIACAVCAAPVTPAMLATVSNAPITDVEDALASLQKYYLVPAVSQVEGEMLFGLTRNTQALVKELYGDSPEWEQCEGALEAFELRPQSRKEVTEVRQGCMHARNLVQRGRLREAAMVLDRLEEQYPNRTAILQTRGWLYKRWEPPRVAEARELFRRAHELNHRGRDLYWHWAELEMGQMQYKAAADAAEAGLVRTGDNISLRFQAARARHLLAGEYMRQLAPESGMDELSKVLEHVRSGARLSALSDDDARMKSRLFQIGMKAARHHKVAGAENEMLQLWRDQLPQDTWRSEYEVT